MNNAGGMVGFNPEVLISTCNVLYECMDNILLEVCAHFGNYCKYSARVWASPEAVKYFNNYANNTSSVLKSIYYELVEIYDDIKYAAKSWERTTGYTFGQSFFGRGFVPTMYNLEIKSEVKDNINGVVGVDCDAFIRLSKDVQRLVTNQVPPEFEKIMRVLQSLSFVGRSQQSSLIESMVKIKDRIIAKSNEIVDDAVAMSNIVVNKYGDTAGAVSQAFDAVQPVIN